MSRSRLAIMFLCIFWFIGCDKDETPPQPPPSEYKLQSCENTTEYLRDLHSIEVKVGTDTNSIKLLPDNIYYLKTSYSNNGYTNLDVITLKEYPGGMYIYDHYKICNLPDTVKNIIESGNSPASIIISGKVFVGDWSHQHSHDHIENFYNLELTSIRWGGDDEPH